MQRNIAETILGAVVLLVAAGFLWFFYHTTDIKPVSGFELKATFSKIDGLQPGSEVRISGVRVGQVIGFELDKDYQALVHISVDPNVKLPRDTSAEIASAGLMAGKFMTLRPGNDEVMLKSGDTIDYTQSTPGLEQLLGQVIFSLNKDKDGKDDGGAAPGKKEPAPSPQEETP